MTLRGTAIPRFRAAAVRIAPDAVSPEPGHGREPHRCELCGAPCAKPGYCDSCWERKADLDFMVARHRRYWADVKRRRERYGYGLLGRIRELWRRR